ncbi:MAG: ankyrin repeat domain-containing protein [Nitrospira sp.]|nr:ankyrin repeat domain-containing protein [Nitrospira sp.]
MKVMLASMCAGLVMVVLGMAVTASPAPDKDQLLIAAAERNDVESVKRLLRDGAGVQARDAQGRTGLMAATYHNHVDVARVLIEAGSDVNAQDAMQNSPLLLAGASGYLDIVRMTLAARPDFTVYNRFGGTALIPACERGHVEVVKALLKTTIDVNHVNRLGWTALLEAILLSDGGTAHQEIVRLLLAAGANPNLADHDGATPLRHARQKGYRVISDLLLAAGAHE